MHASLARSSVALLFVASLVVACGGGGGGGGGSGSGGGGGGGGGSGGGAPVVAAAVRVDTAAGGSIDIPHACRSGATVHAVWMQSDVVHYSRSADGGLTWLATDVTIDTSGAGLAEDLDTLAVACDGADVYAAWGGDHGVWASWSHDGGASWSLSTRIDHSGLGTYHAFRVRVCVSGQSACVLWRRDLGALFSNHTADGGTTWQAADREVDDGSTGNRFDACCDGLSVFVAWEDDRQGSFSDVFADHSTDGGATWNTDVRVSTSRSSASGSDNTFPRLACGGGRVYAAWQTVHQPGSASTGIVEVRASSTLETSWVWVPDAAVATNETSPGVGDGLAHRYTPRAIACDADTAVVAVIDERGIFAPPPDPFDLFTATTTDGGAAWTRSTGDLSTGGAFVPVGGVALLVEGSEAVVAWSAGSGGAVGLVARRSVNSGGTWSSATAVSAAGASDVSLVHEPGQRTLVWLANDGVHASKITAP